MWENSWRVCEKKKVYSIAEFLFLCCLFLTHDCAAIYRCCFNFFFRSQNICFEFFSPFSVCFFPALFDVWNFFETKTFLKFLCVYYFSFLVLLKLNFNLFYLCILFSVWMLAKTKIKTEIVQLNKKRGSKFRILTETL